MFDEVRHRADGLSAKGIVGRHAGQGEHGEELGRPLLQAVADAGGDVTVVDEKRLASAAGEVPAQSGHFP